MGRRSETLAAIGDAVRMTPATAARASDHERHRCGSASGTHGIQKPNQDDIAEPKDGRGRHRRDCPTPSRRYPRRVAWQRELALARRRAGGGNQRNPRPQIVDLGEGSGFSRTGPDARARQVRDKVRLVPTCTLSRTREFEMRIHMGSHALAATRGRSLPQKTGQGASVPPHGYARFLNDLRP